MSNPPSPSIELLETPTSPSRMTQGKYKVIASLGKGGMANVYLASMSGPSRFNKLLVLKLLRDDVDVSRDELVTMFLDEARLAARLQHRNIVQTYEFGEVAGQYHMAMEYLDGQPLRALQHKLPGTGLPLAEELRILAETARGLHYAHGLRAYDDTPLGVVHRDVSPQNVFITYDGEVKLLDFGIAKTEEAEHLTKVGAIKGKVDYMAPEQVRGEGIDRRADVFALGAMMWEAITKDRFAGGKKVTEVTKFHKRLTGGEPNVRAVQPDVPEALAVIVDRAIALHPDARFATAEQFADSVDAYLATLPVKPTDKSLAALLAERFREERATLRKLIEQQIQIIQGKGSNGERSSSGVRPLDLHLTMSGVLDLSAPGSAPSARVNLPESISGAPAKSGMYWKIGVVAGGLLLLGAALFVAAGSREAQPVATQNVAPAPAATPAATAIQPPAAAPAPESLENTVKFVVDVSPSDAVVTLDGAPLPQLPFEGSFRRGRDQHHVEASAEGYQPIRQLTTFENDRRLSIVLRPLPASAKARARRPGGGAVDVAPLAPQAAPAAAQPVNTRTEEPAPGTELRTRPKRAGFDVNDPYAN
jgi:serine/threonine-protein kinase